MQDNFPKLSAEEAMRADNDFLKMKLMLERGATFTRLCSDKDLPPDIENRFLKQVIAFESALQEEKSVKVFDKIGKPTHFLPVTEIAEADIENAWKQLCRYLFRYGLTLGACSPAVSKRELYRFAIEELFELEMMDVTIPGILYGFIYDEFYPDTGYENQQTAEYHFLRWMFAENFSNPSFYFAEENLILNDHPVNTRKDLYDIVNKFRSNYDSFADLETIDVKNTCTAEACTIEGEYKVQANYDDLTIELSGGWKVSFVRNESRDLWEMREMWIEGITFHNR